MKEQRVEERVNSVIVFKVIYIFVFGGIELSPFKSIYFKYLFQD